MAKSKEMEKFLEAASMHMFSKSRNDSVCVICGSDKIKPEDFVDDLSRREFQISHMCQCCQDATFAE